MNSRLERDQTIDFKRYYLYGFIINLIPIYVFYPIRTIKTIQQSNIGTSSATTMGKVFTERIKAEGVRGFFKGVGVYGLGSISGRLVHFSTYDALRDMVHKGKGSSVGLGWLENRSHSTINALLGTLSAVITSSFMIPFDVISQQLQVSKSPLLASNNVTQINNTSPTLKRAISTATTSNQPTYIVTSHNTPLTHNVSDPHLHPVSLRNNFITRLKPKDVPLHRFLYRGWAAGLLNTISFFPAYFFTYTYTLETLQENQHRFPILPSSYIFLSVSAGVMAGATATFTSAPFDVVKTRIQIARESGQKELRWWNMAASIVKTEGVKGLFVGMSARMWVIVPLGSLNFWVFEKVRDWSVVKIPLKVE
ncbi:22319_t:CDS:1 [Gigaspora margarita]|uniref:22319_t:CDS:1 n=2 Tax=Gigaspora margarita TaxID=4874 RepID=A0ABN7WEH2_GIGMA|nr:mitochondrial carrier [Gigaspora margarita]CAG8829532.1 22319_t:CDS:1 [Gigaspora margarita]